MTTTETDSVPATGVRYYAVVDAFDEHTPLAVIASVNQPGAPWRQYRFDRPHSIWVEDPRVVVYLVGGTDGLRARTLTDEQAAEILGPWGGQPGDFPSEE